jgi:ABC-type phosphate transport system substrate-binding protein
MFKPVAMAAVMVAGVLAAGAASAQIAVGGGATLPEVLYDQILPSGVGHTNFSYTGTGSGAGKTAFYNNNATAFKNESLATAPFWPATQSVHFAGSDSLVSAAERDSYNSARLATWGRMIQVPAVGTSVLVPYKRAGIANLNLTDAQMCAIFSNKTGGQTWGQLRGTTDATTVKVVYRTDTSGTTELLARYLVAACPSSGFVVSNAFTTMVAGALTGGTIPSHWVGANGSSGVSGSFGVDGRVGYLSPEAAYTGSDNSVVARINNSLPSAAAIQAVLATKALPTAGTTPAEILAAANPLNWVPAYQKPASGYPIFGTTNLLVNQCYRDPAIQTKVKNFLTGLFGTTHNAAITAHNFVNLPATGTTTTNWKKAVSDVFLNAAHPLGIGNVNACNNIGRPLAN